jgi:hypothetical protein
VLRPLVRKGADFAFFSMDKRRTEENVSRPNNSFDFSRADDLAGTTGLEPAASAVTV